MSSPLLHLVRDATQAPSSHNTQPWAFSIRDGEIDLIADRTRALPVNDPHDRELTISCGAALLTLRVAAAAAGRRADVAVLPEGDQADLLARVALTPERGLTDGEHAAAIERRHTHRRPFADRPLPGGLLDRLTEAAAAEGARLEPLTGPERSAFTDLVALGDESQFADVRWRRELAAWLHSRRTGDGLPQHPLAAPVARTVVSHLDLGRSTATKDRDLAVHAPAVAVLGTPGDEPADWLAAGQALQRVLLVAAGEGVQASYLNQPIQVEELRPRMRALAPAAGEPQVALRLGFPEDEVPAAPRRPVEDVLD